MKIDFELRKKDLLAFHIYSLLHDRTARLLYSLIFFIQVVLGYFPIIADLVFVTKMELFGVRGILYALLQATTSFIILVIFCLLIFAVVHGFYLFCLMFRYKNGDGIIGLHRIELNGNGFVEISDVRMVEHSWKTVQRLVDWRGYFLFHTSPTNATLIPKRQFPSKSETINFLNEAKRLKENSSLNYSPSYLASKS